VQIHHDANIVFAEPGDHARPRPHIIKAHSSSQRVYSAGDPSEGVAS
jgi:hypothetical protein